MTTWTDLFAGAGGSSTGIVASGLGEVRYAANHWDLAVEVHNANHPLTEHVVADVSQFNPRRIRSTDFLWASPECTTHSRARGKSDRQPDLFDEVLPSEAVQRSRATMWDVPRFAEVHAYQAIIVENVVEVRNWQPYQAWLQAMRSLGYQHREVFVNAMHAGFGGNPAPQSRDRIYVVFWQGTHAPDIEQVLRPPAWCSHCEYMVEARQCWKPGRSSGRYRQQYVYCCAKCGVQVEPSYLPASTAIDWSLQGKRIGDRAKPLSEKTRTRIAAGIRRYWTPLLVEDSGGNSWDAANPLHPRFRDPDGYYRAWPLTDPMRTVTTREYKALIVPVEGRSGKQANPSTDALRTLTGRSETAVAYPPITEPSGDVRDALISPYYGNTMTAGSTSEALPTVTTTDRFALIERGQTPVLPTPVDEPIRTITASGTQSLITADQADALVDDCLFRMLEPSEIARGMAFPDSYLWQGPRRARVRMAGNAVCCNVARDLAIAVQGVFR